MNIIFTIAFVIYYVIAGMWLETLIKEPAFFAFYGSISIIGYLFVMTKLYEINHN